MFRILMLSHTQNLFAVAPNDSDLIAAINSTYGLEIDYDEFVRIYTFVMTAP